MWITVKALVSKVDEDLLVRGIQNDDDFVWRPKAIRSETIESIEQISKNKTLLIFPESKLVIDEAYQTFYDRVENLDYVKVTIGTPMEETQFEEDETYGEEDEEY